MSMGSGLFGMHPDRNDPGLVDESSADPNARLNQRGRFDPGRAFAAHLYMGFVPVDDLELVCSSNGVSEPRREGVGRRLSI